MCVKGMEKADRFKELIYFLRHHFAIFVTLVRCKQSHFLLMVSNLLHCFLPFSFCSAIFIIIYYFLNSAQYFLK